jgi:hypothetical protein
MTNASVSHGSSGLEAWIANDATFGARLALIRQRCGWGNLKEAAVACGIAVESWRSWERDGTLPRRYLDVCAQIARATGCDYGWLVDRRPSGSSQVTEKKISAKLRAIKGEARSSTPCTPLLAPIR